MKPKTRLWCALLLCFLCTAGGSSVFGQSKKQQHILLISSYVPSKENSRIIINSFSNELTSKLDCRLTVEYMDSESTTDFTAWKEWMIQLFAAYKTLPDAVVIVGGEAWTAYSESCPESWKKVPVVLGGVKQGYIDYAHRATGEIRDMNEIRGTRETFADFRVTGYYIKDYFLENLRLIRQLQPEVRHIAYIYDNRYGFRFHTPYMQKMARETGFEDLHPLYGNELTTMQLVDSLTAMDDTYAILSAGWYSDAKHYPHVYSMLHNEMTLRPSKFFYLIMDQGDNNPNYLGGYYVAAQDIGRDVAELTYEVITKGIRHSPRFRLTPSAPKYHINNKRLSATRIDPSRLPGDTVLYNTEPSFLKTYFWQTLAVSLILLALITILVIRMQYYRRLTDVKARMMEEQKVLREKADESNRLKSAFLANMSHEIRTPLNAIVGFSSQIALAEDKEEAQLYLEIIENNNNLLLQLINDILDLSKIEAGQLDFDYSQTDIVEICRNMEQVYRSRVKPDVTLQCTVPDKSCVVNTEQNRITQVVSNFLSNAVKFTDKGSIRFGYEHIAGGLRFFVEDTGKGIAPENLSKVFVRFEKFDHFVPGNGLGMSICESIVKKLGGEIGVDSELGRGSTFWFTLPCTNIRTEAPEPQQTEASVSASDEGTQVISGRQKTILIAEDNESNYLLLSCILKHDYHLEWAKNGEQALEMHRRFRPDLILMDVKMPLLDGFGATARIRETDPEVLIVALTAYAYPEDREKADKAGCNAFLAKPINRRQLLDLLHELGI